MMPVSPLTAETMLTAISQLVECDRDLAYIIHNYGQPPFWYREAGFPGLVRIILGQQVSVAAANAIYGKLTGLLESLTPEGFLELTEIELKLVGLSRQKIAATRALATAIASQAINLHELEQQDDEIIRQELIKIKGIGNWTVDIYLMMSLRRPDAFPQSDLGVIIAYQKLKQLPNHPTPQQMSAVAKQWQPWRAVATRMLWHYYLNLTKPDTYAQAPQAFIP